MERLTLGELEYERKKRKTCWEIFLEMKDALGIARPDFQPTPLYQFGRIRDSE